MKLKLGSVQLVCIILIQLILIDAFLILCFIKKINNKPLAGSESVVTALDNKSVNNVPMVADTPKKGENETHEVQNKSKEFSVLKDFFITFGLDKPIIRDFRITGKHSRQKSFIATAYDLSYESCGKYPSHPEYGITFSGKPAVRGRTVAVDPKVIPLGSKLYIEFPKEYTYMNGWYAAEDTGSKIKGNVIDIFFGKSAPRETKKFGRRRISVQIVAPNGNIE